MNLRKPRCPKRWAGINICSWVNFSACVASLPEGSGIAKDMRVLYVTLGAVGLCIVIVYLV
jgi:hypothetical protein